MDIALIGGHGKVALLAEPLLTGAGASVDAIIRDAAQAPDVEATGARAVVADIEHLDADGWDALLRGHDAVIWTAGAGGGDPSRTRPSTATPRSPRWRRPRGSAPGAT